MAIAHVRILARPPYNGAAIADSLGALGFDIPPGPPRRWGPGDILVTWNRYPRDERLAAECEAAGGRVFVIENGYFGRNHPGGPWYAVSVGQHNGVGVLPEPSRDRWRRLGIDLGPWFLDGREIVVLGTRGFGSEKVREPAGWANRTADHLRRTSGRPVRIRKHPGAQADCSTADLLDDLRDAYAAVTWGSGAGLKALTAGIPVFHGLRGWIARDAARLVDFGVGERWSGDRAPVFHRIASAMWSLAEIRNGDAFRWAI